MSIRSVRVLARAALNAQVARPAVARAVPAFVARAAAPLATRSFTFSARRLGNGESDSQLASVLTAEQKYEAESAELSSSETPAWLEEFRAEGVWEIIEQPGSDDVSITRKFGNETLKLTFQISDLDHPADADLDAEGAESSSGGVADVDGVEAADAEGSAPYITCSLLVTKAAHPSAMAVDLEAADDGFEITNVAMFDKATAEAQGAEGDWERRSRYMGPVFEDLDEGVQDAFNAYLAERGVDDALAQFVIDYAAWKEQKDYVNWLEQVKGFVQQ